MIIRIAIALAILIVGGHSSNADEAAAWEALRAGGHVALVRHTSAPGTGDPPGFTLGDCTTQRNLNAKGRADAAAIGARIKAEGVAFEKILSSPWCRCVDTARLMDLGPVETEPTFSNAFVLSDQREALTAGARTLLAGWQGPGTLLVVTHGANIRALTGVSPASGEIVVVAIRAGESIEIIGRIPPPRWRRIPAIEVERRASRRPSRQKTQQIAEIQFRVPRASWLFAVQAREPETGNGITR